MFSTPLPLVLLLPLLVLWGAHCLDPEEINEGQELVGAAENEDQQDDRKDVEKISTEDEIIQDFAEYIDNIGQDSEATEDADFETSGREGRRMQERKIVTKGRKDRRTESKNVRERGGGTKRKYKPKKGLNIMRLFKDDQDSTKTKKNNPAVVDTNEEGNKEQQNKEISTMDEEDDTVKKVKKGERGKMRGNLRKKDGKLDDDAKQTIVTSKNHPVFTFSSMSTQTNDDE